MMDDRISVLLENGSRRRHGRRAEPVVRLRVLQYMSIIHMKKLLAREVSIMSERRHVTGTQMGRVRELMKGYGIDWIPLSLIPTGPDHGDSRRAQRPAVHARAN
jgi:hypothetical protein